MDDEKEEEGEQFEKDAKLEARPFKKVALDEEAIVATALVIMVAGYDTTGIKYSLHWVLRPWIKRPRWVTATPLTDLSQSVVLSSAK